MHSSGDERERGIASAKQMEADGDISLSKMNSQFLQKIEELTLYIIDLKKENEQLKERISKIENK